MVYSALRLLGLLGFERIQLSWGWRHRPAAPFGLKSGSVRTSLPLPAAMTPCWGCVDLGAMLDPSWAMLGACWGYLELCWDHVGSCSVKIGARLAHLGLCWGYGSLNGSMLAHFEVLLGLCWRIWGLCWGQVRPSWAMLGLWPRYFHDVTFIPKFCLKKLSPVACESYVWLSKICLSSTSPQ